MIIYLIYAPVLRYGLNGEFYPKPRLWEFRNSIIYASANLFFILIVERIGFYLLSVEFPDVYSQIIVRIHNEHCYHCKLLKICIFDY